MIDAKELRDKLRVHVTYDEGVEIRKKIRAMAILNYPQKYSDEDHMHFIKRNRVTTTKQHPQSTNHPYYYGMFSCVTQHIMADTMEELFDKAIDIEKDGGVINKYFKLSN